VNAIEIKNLTKIFSAPAFKNQPKVTALKNVTLNIEQGTIFTLVGPNGAGKTTLIRILAGLTSLTKGEVKINQLPLNKKTCRKIGLFTAEIKGYWDALTGYENLIFFCALQNLVGNQAKKRISEIVDLFEMSLYILKPVYTYSSGMKHKLLLARSLVHNPDILFLDEPINALDPMAARNFHQLIRNRLNQELGKTIFLSTHQLEEAQEISDTVGFLFQGELIWQKKANLFRSKQSNLLNEYLETAGQV